mgnify:CR=1 FL=1
MKYKVVVGFGTGGKVTLGETEFLADALNMAANFFKDLSLDELSAIEWIKIEFIWCDKV